VSIKKNDFCPTVTPLKSPELGPGASLLGQDEIDEILRVLVSGSLSRDYGPDRQDTVLRFEARFAHRMQVEHALGVTSGTAALRVALVAGGVGPGDEVIVPSCTHVSTAGAAVLLGAVPVFAEIDESLNLDPSLLEQVITSRTKAIVPVHVSGVPCQMDRILEVARARKLLVVEDCAQSCGASYLGKPIGTWGDLGAFSLQFGKVITAGEGGVVTTNNPNLYERAIRFHDQGAFRTHSRRLSTAPTLEPFVGDNLRMSELTGAIALAQLRKLDEIITRLRSLHGAFVEATSGLPGIRHRPCNDLDGHLGLHWSIVLDDRETASHVREQLRQLGLTTRLPYGGRTVYSQAQIRERATATESSNPWTRTGVERRYEPGLCPRSEDLLQRVVILMRANPRLDASDVQRVADALRAVALGGR
jgi:8-amino-3,8-dideoxy-alpha-D-manno-octulosonate transaminase